MIVRLNENNELELTEKAMFVKDFRDLYNYYTGKLNNHDRAMAAFGVMYYMYYFDSRFLLEYTDEEERLKEVKKFVYKGDEVKDIKVYQKAVETYKTLMDEEQTALYLVMKGNTAKIKDYAEHMVLKLSGDTGDPVEDAKRQAKEILVTYTEFTKTNLSLPEQAENLTLFKEKLLKQFKAEVDIYGGGERGAYED